MEVPIQKPRRKHPEVPVHNEINFQKTYSANYHSKKHKTIEAKSETPVRLSKKHLYKENQMLLKENEEIVGKFNELEELSVKRVTKLKEKIQDLQQINEKINNENEMYKRKIENLLENYKALKQELEASKVCQNCKDLEMTVEKISSDNNLLRIANKEAEEDLNMLKTVVFRLNLQLERYQEKLRKIDVKLPKISQNPSTDNVSVISNDGVFIENHKDHSHTPIAWGRVNVHTLGPLLDAYQDTLVEKEEIIESYQKELSEFTGKLKEVIKENEDLYQQLNEDAGSSAKLKLEVEGLKNELKICKEQNDALIKKCALKQDKIEEILKLYEAKVEQQKRDYTVLHDQYHRTTTELAALKEKNKALVETYDDFKNERQNYMPIAVYNSSVNECKRWYEELKVQYEQEKKKMQETIAEQSKLINDLNDQLAKEKSEYENKVKQLEKTTKKLEGKILELEQALSEVQQSRSSCRKQLHKAMMFAKDLVGEQETLLKALNQKQQETKSAKRIGYDIASRMDLLKTQLKEVQKNASQELNSVEQRLLEQNKVIETMQEEHDKEIEFLKEIIRKQEDDLVLNVKNPLPMPHYLLFRDKHK